MKALAGSLITLIMAIWVVAIALISVQNVFITDDVTNTPALISLRFLGQSSIALPLGLILAISAAIGMIVTSSIVFATLSKPWIIVQAHKISKRRSDQ